MYAVSALSEPRVSVFRPPSVVAVTGGGRDPAVSYNRASYASYIDNSVEAAGKYAFRAGVPGYTKMLAEVSERLADENRIPPSLMQIIQKMVDGFMQPESPHEVDRVV